MNDYDSLFHGASCLLHANPCTPSVVLDSMLCREAGRLKQALKDQKDAHTRQLQEHDLRRQQEQYFHQSRVHSL